MGKMTKRKERKGNSLHLSAQTLSQTIPAISCTKSPPWVSLSWMAASWIRGKSLCLYPHSMIDDLSWCWSVCSDSSDYSVLRCKAPRTTSKDISSVNNASATPSPVTVRGWEGLWLFQQRVVLWQPGEPDRNAQQQPGWTQNLTQKCWSFPMIA